MDSPFIRDPDHQFAHVIFYALMVNIYIYILTRLALLSSTVLRIWAVEDGRLMKTTKGGDPF